MGSNLRPPLSKASPRTLASGAGEAGKQVLPMTSFFVCHFFVFCPLFSFSSGRQVSLSGSLVMDEVQKSRHLHVTSATHVGLSPSHSPGFPFPTKCGFPAPGDGAFWLWPTHRQGPHQPPASRQSSPRLSGHVCPRTQGILWTGGFP